MKNEKFLLDIQTKRGDIANEILNAAIDAELTLSNASGLAISWETGKTQILFCLKDKKL